MWFQKGAIVYGGGGEDRYGRNIAEASKSGNQQ